MSENIYYVKSDYDILENIRKNEFPKLNDTLIAAKLDTKIGKITNDLHRQIRYNCENDCEGNYKNKNVKKNRDINTENFVCELYKDVIQKLDNKHFETFFDFMCMEKVERHMKLLYQNKSEKEK